MTFIRYACFIAFGMLMAAMGYGIASWQLWAVLVTAAVLQTASLEEGKRK